MLTWTLEELIYQLGASARTRGRAVLTCAPGVLEAIRDGVPPADPVPVGMPNLPMLMGGGVDIVRDDAAAPGSFRLVRHTPVAYEDRDGRKVEATCWVDLFNDRVLHGRCPVVAEGILAGGDADAK